MHLLRQPFTWLVVLELCALAALAVLGWHLLGARSGARLGAPVGAAVHALPAVGPPPAPAASAPQPAVSLSIPTPARAGPTPGLGTSPEFLNRQLHAVNRDESAWEHAEWTILQAGMRFARAYIESVVLPAVRSAQGGR